VKTFSVLDITSVIEYEFYDILEFKIVARKEIIKEKQKKTSDQNPCFGSFIVIYRPKMYTKE